MTTIETILSLRELVNRGNTNDNISLDNIRAVNLLNQAQIKYLKERIENKNNEDVRRVQAFLTSSNLKLSSKKSKKVAFSLPTNYFEFSNVLPIASSGKCKDDILAWEAKSENINLLLSDDNNKPSFYWRECFFTISDNTILFYVDNFDITNVELVYYRKPKKIDIEGYINADGSSSKTISPEWDEYSLQRIIEIAAKDFNINTDNLQRFQVDNMRIKTT
jgi:hypothetical protein